MAEDRRADDGEWGVIKLSAVSPGRFLADEHKALAEGTVPERRFEIRLGNVLLTRANTPDLVGEACVVRDVRPHLMLCDLVYRLNLNHSAMEGRYLVYWLGSRPGRSQVEADARGSSQSMVKVSQGHIRSWLVPVPPLPEQRAIADFLDRKTAAVDALIDKKERLVHAFDARLQERIANAVLHGLSSAPLGPSGVEWMGAIPAHWGVRRLSLLAVNMQTGPFGSQLHASDYFDGGTPLVNPSHLVDGRIAPDDKCRVSDETLSRLTRHRLREGDLVFGRRGELGRCGAVTKQEAGWLCGTGSLRVRVDTAQAVPAYVALVSSLTRSREWLLLQSVGATMDNLNTNILGRLPLPVPPLAEQLSILVFAQSINEANDRTTTALKKSIDALREYRQALITAAVTGQLDVAAQEAA